MATRVPPFVCGPAAEDAGLDLILAYAAAAAAAAIPASLPRRVVKIGGQAYTASARRSTSGSPSEHASSADNCIDNLAREEGEIAQRVDELFEMDEIDRTHPAGTAKPAQLNWCNPLWLTKTCWSGGEVLALLVRFSKLVDPSSSLQTTVSALRDDVLGKGELPRDTSLSEAEIPACVF